MAYKGDLLEDIKTMIYTEYHPGDMFPTEFELMERFGVGRSLIRENLKILFSMGLLVRKGTGTCIAENTIGCLSEPFKMMVNMYKADAKYLHELRTGIELWNYTIALERVTDEDIQEFERIVWRMKNPDFSPEEFLNNDALFHTTLAKATRNPILVELLTAVRTAITTPNHKTINVNPEVRKITVEAHIKILEALKSKDLEGGKTALQEHFILSEKIFWNNKPDDIIQESKK